MFVVTPKAMRPASQIEYLGDSSDAYLAEDR